MNEREYCSLASFTYCSGFLRILALDQPVTVGKIDEVFELPRLRPNNWQTWAHCPKVGSARGRGTVRDSDWWSNTGSQAQQNQNNQARITVEICMTVTLITVRHALSIRLSGQRRFEWIRQYSLLSWAVEE